MGGGKLNLYAPLLSVRRISTSALTDGETGKVAEKSCPNRQGSLQMNKSDMNLEQVTEPATVPFMWERFPGRPKDDDEPLPHPPLKESSVTERVPSRKLLDSVNQSLERYLEDKISSSSRLEAGSFSADAYKSDSFKEEKNGNVSSNKDDDDDTYSDAQETLSPTGSFSLNCSATNMSGLGTSGSKLSTTPSTDSKTRDFMMSRFLPAAKAMTLDSPQYSLRKQPTVVEQPRQIANVVNPHPRTSHYQYGSNVVPQYEPEEEKEESEDEQSEFEDPVHITTKGCGLFPRLCFKNALGILNPVPGLRTRTRAIKSSTCKPRTSGNSVRATSDKQIVTKHSKDGNSKYKSISANQSPRLPEIKNKPVLGSQRRAFSGELQIKRSFSPFRRLEQTQNNNLKHKSFSANQSPKLPEVRNKPVNGFQRLAFSGELQTMRNSSPYRRSEHPQIASVKHKSPSANQSPSFPEVRTRLVSGSQRLAFSGEMQTMRSSSPFRRSVSGCISPYRAAVPKSSHNGVGFFGVPKGSESCYMSNLNIDNKINQKMVFPPHPRTDISASPAVEKTLYIDTVNNTYSFHKASATAGMNFVASESTGMKENGAANSSLQNAKYLDNAKYGFAEHKKKTFQLNQGPDQECESARFSRMSTSRNRDVYKEQSSKGYISQKDDFSSEQSPLELPLPKSPSESWLWRTLPSRSSRNLVSHPHSDHEVQSKHQDSERSSSNAKWEMIVKSSKLQKDHIRYSEELIARVSQQPKA